MLQKAKQTAKSVAEKARSLIVPDDIRVHLDEVQTAREYIAAYWEKLKRYHPKDDETLLGLPEPYLVPAFEAGHEFDFNEMYYWDSYFMVQGMLDREHQELVTGILTNLLDLQRRFKAIPNASRTYLTGRSQPPLLTTFIFDVYDSYQPGEKWLRGAMERARDEYEKVWMGTAKPNWRQVYRGLSRYYDINMLHDLAEAESGWDMTPRFNRKALNYLPVDLNSLLYKYEMDFARAERIFGNGLKADEWEQIAMGRKQTMNELMWSNNRNLFYDYNFVKEKRGTVSSLAAYFPMWAGLADDKQAKELVKNLKKFEFKGGLGTTDQQLNQRLPGTLPGSMPTQWAYPNGWAPLHFIVIKGLQRYGYTHEARRIALKWLKTNLTWFERHHVFLEKYNVVSPDKPPLKGVYPSQTGFGWTNAVFERLCQDYLDHPV